MGDLLCKEFLAEDETQYPSPKAFWNKIILKGKTKSSIIQNYEYESEKENVDLAEEAQAINIFEDEVSDEDMSKITERDPLIKALVDQFNWDKSTVENDIKEGIL